MDNVTRATAVSALNAQIFGLLYPQPRLAQERQSPPARQPLVAQPPTTGRIDLYM